MATDTLREGSDPMTSRERTLAILLIGLIVLGGGSVLGYYFVYSPLQDKYAAAEKLQTEANDLEDKADAVVGARAKIAAVKRQSLPPDINLAKAQYKLMLEQLLRTANIKDFKIPDMRILDSRPPGTPELLLPNPNAPTTAPAATPAPTPAGGTAPAPAATAQPLKKPAYTRLEFKVEVTKADIWQIVDFLKAFYEVDLLHQITTLSIVRSNKVDATRSGLNMTATIEAIILDKAEDRKWLLPPTPTKAAVLASAARDYSFIAWKDMFYGVLPSATQQPFALRSFDNVVLSRDEKAAEVRVRLSGEGSKDAKVVATASGSLLPEGELKIDPESRTITIPGAGTEETPDDATSTISVVATSSEGVTQKGSFKVTVRPPDKPPTPPGPDISGAIKLVILSGRSDGLQKAVIYDAASPFKYELTTTGKNVEVLKYWQATGKNWKKDLDYEQPAGVLTFSDEFSRTKRTFKVIAFEEDAVVISESGRSESAKTDAPKKSFGPRTGSSSTKQGPANPLALVAGNLAIAAPTPILYRWTLGKSLLELTKLTPEESKTILKRVAADGPIVSAISSGK
ncbi:MAG: hypothetical protein K8U57_34955 [Planctomycetes bacterium]|nr:hypothetical protein [Planctomycetota bacterium]